MTQRQVALLLAAVLLFYLGVLLLSAWHCDDAWITFRTARNFWEGHGLRWNVAERVQAYTHPLWLFVAIGCYGVAGELYFSILLVSFALALATAWRLGRAAPHQPWGAIAVILLLSTSRAVVDYATSGLETPLLGLLAVLFALGLRDRPSPRRLWWHGLLLAAAALTRPDAVLLVGPGVAWCAWRSEGSVRARLGWLALGLAPLVLWELFSALYYGAFVPNTAFAKLNLEVSRLALIGHGFRYLFDLVRHDPITAVLLATGLGLALSRGAAATRAVAAGAVAYLVYVVYIGGDFMSGRFFVAPTLVAIAAGLRALADRPLAWPAALRARRLHPALVATPLVAYAMLWPGSPWRATPMYGEEVPEELRQRAIAERGGVADERAYYYPSTGLLPVLARYSETVEAGLPIPPYRSAIWGRILSERGPRVELAPEAGFLGYFAGPNVYVLDQFALGDPLLARLPYRPRGKWRVGHYERPLPAGYFETLTSGTIRLRDPDLAAFYRDLQVVLDGPLWSSHRLRIIGRLITGGYDDTLERATAEP